MDKAQKIKKDIEELDKWIKTNPDSRELKRAIAVKLSLQGWTYQAIATILNRHLQKFVSQSQQGRQAD
jgi:putative transposase